jgi:DMSO/TMAO reductase YedYZ molybdopterin-dependent catalytic subunit
MLRQYRAHPAHTSSACCAGRRSFHPPTEEIRDGHWGSKGRQSGPELSDRIPPGQHLVDNFPVLTAGPTPRIEPADWTFTLKVGPRPVKEWSWSEFNALPRTRMTRDIHCVTPWSKLNTAWEVVAVYDILATLALAHPLRLRSHIATTDTPPRCCARTSRRGRRWSRSSTKASRCRAPTGAGAPARAASLLLDIGQVGERASIHRADEPGFRELRGYHMYGDPWREQRDKND